MRLLGFPDVNPARNPVLTPLIMLPSARTIPVPRHCTQGTCRTPPQEGHA